MQEFNGTPYGVSAFVSQIEPEEPFITIVVTGLFALAPGERCRAEPAEAQARPGQARYFADKIGNSRICDGDNAPFKPRADCLLIGAAYAPGGSPAPFVEVEFGVGSMRKKLHVFGDRTWVRQPDGGAAISAPAPFARMPIRNELAHGGLRSVHNKHGIGFGELGREAGARLSVANIVGSARQALPADEDAEPAGFGVLPPEMGARAALRGTFDGEWLYRRKPFPPKDFDPGFFNGARPDQQIDGYLSGDEVLLFRNLHPVYPDYRAQLPGTRVRLFVHHVLEHAAPVFEEVQTVLDTCLVDMEAETVRLTWRGTLHSARSAALDQIPNLMIVEEPTGEPGDQEGYFRRFGELIRAAEPPPPPPAGPTPAEQERIDAINSKALAEMVQALRKHGADEALVREVEAQSSVDKALEILTRVAEELKSKTPG